MPDRKHRRNTLVQSLRSLAGMVLHPFSPRSQATRDAYADIFQQLNRNQPLEDLLLLPAAIREALQLDSFHIFLMQGAQYVLESSEQEHCSFSASCSTVLRMKRDRKPAPFVRAEERSSRLDGWQMLATEEEVDQLIALRTQMLLPLEGRTHLTGFVSLSRPHRRPFVPYELRFLRELGPRLGRALETALFVQALSDQAVERSRVLAELELAREVQERLLPLALPKLTGIQMAAAYRSAEQVGGDYYDAFLSRGKLCIVVADVSGKGMSAALVMAALRATLHALILQPDATPQSILTQCNAMLHQASSASRYATLFFAIYDPDTHTLTYVNAGHNPPLLRRANGTLQRLTTGGTVLGLLPVVTYTAESLSLTPGDTLLAFTDGVSEATNAKGEEWQESGILNAWLRGPGFSTDDLVNHLLDELGAFTLRSPQQDDITLLVLERTATELD